MIDVLPSAQEYVPMISGIIRWTCYFNKFSNDWLVAIKCISNATSAQFLRHTNVSGMHWCWILRTWWIVVAPWSNANHGSNFIITLRHIQTGRTRVASGSCRSQFLRFAQRIMLSEQLAQVQLGNIIKHRQRQHHSNQTCIVSSEKISISQFSVAKIVN